MASLTAGEMVGPPRWGEGAEEFTAQLPHDSRIQICYSTFGSREEPCVLLIQDVACPGVYWSQAFCSMIAEGGFFVVRYDQRDTGKSSHFPDRNSRFGLYGTLVRSLLHGSDGRSQRYSMQDLCRDAMGLLDALNVSAAHVVGYAMGAAVAQQIMVDYPDRVLSATLLSSFHLNYKVLWVFRSAYANRCTDAALGARQYAEGEVKFFMRHRGGYEFPEETFRELALWSYDRQTPSSDAVPHHLAAVLSSSDCSEALSQLNPCCLQCAGPNPDSSSTSTVYNSVAALRALARLLWHRRSPPAITMGDDDAGSLPAAARHVPVLVIHGGKDTATPLSYGESVARSIPGALLVIYPKMGHYIPPALFKDIADAIIVNARAAGREHDNE